MIKQNEKIDIIENGNRNREDQKKLEIEIENKKWKMKNKELNEKKMKTANNIGIEN